MADRKTTAADVGNVTINSGFASWATGIPTVSPEPGNVTINSGFSARDIGLELAEDLNLIGAIGIPDISEPVYRGLIGVTYVFSIGTPPIGATDIVIIGYT
jgi:hypothetical protein